MPSRPRRPTLLDGPEDTLPTDKLAAFGHNLRAARISAGIPQAELARLAGLTDQGHLSRIEAGNHNLTFRTMEKLALALGVKLSDLVGPANAAT